MPQELRVVCCFQCRKFQSDIVKKAKKWTCKLCGVQQSIVKEYARGSGRECRLLVQQLSDGSQKADQMERVLAEQVLSGELAMPVVENPMREESDRLLASHEQNRKIDGNRGSKWDSFCVIEDAEEVNMPTTKIEKQKSESSSWTNWGKGNAIDCSKNNPAKPERFSSFKAKTGLVPPSATSQLVPIVDFHRMDKQDKKHFKWQSKNLSQNNSTLDKTSRTVQEPKKSLFRFEPKMSTLSNRELDDVDAFQSKENISLKRTSNAAQLPSSQSPLMSFAKKSKWADFNRPDLELSSSSATPNSNQSEPSHSPVSFSKWEKYIPQADEEDDDFT